VDEDVDADAGVHVYRNVKKTHMVVFFFFFFCNKVVAYNGDVDVYVDVSDNDGDDADVDV